MEKNPTEPMAQLNVLLGEITKMPLGPARDKKWEEAYELFAPAAEELSILRDTISVLAERNQNGESLKSFMKKSGIDTDLPLAIVRPIRPQPTLRVRIKTGFEAAKGYWDRKKGPIAVTMTVATVFFFMVNQRNIKMLDGFIHDENLVGLFEDWAGTEEEMRESPLDWREQQEDDDV